ncbi:hypothetical protein CEE37_15020 [candidate division LCP-89 bacterium B3_LCP]|uniref:Secretion system C-terminal sorting domain-containing protein n=1 Tax=candidate division LCP-89 bacterium B3_LCP TaxID=2012998 RepID=A0A532UNU9_UNCL8|nr:MAG: hypothetical protein CEE37_15020 [candidate division LCP-89 bacterium B3_LCP]
MRIISTISIGLCFLLPLSVLAQITLTADDFQRPPGSTAELHSSGAMIPVNQGLSGANQTWVYTFMETPIAYLQEWHEPSSTPYFGSFPTANQVTTSTQLDQDTYIYHEMNETAYWIRGSGSESGTYIYDNSKPIVEFPLNYLDEWDAVYEYSQGGDTTLYDSTRNIIDAWGTLIDGNNTYQVLRRKGHIWKINSLQGVPYDTTTYWNWAWIAPTYGAVAMMLSAANELEPYFGVGYFNRIVDLTAVEKQPDTILPPVTYLLLPAYPNPFNPQTILSFTMPQAGRAVLSIIDLQGREVACQHDGWLTPGVYHSTFSAENLAGGIYFARLTAGNQQQVQKLVLMK